MNRYESYKDSGVEWIGEIPSLWKTMKVRSCFRERCEKISDKIFAPLSVTKNGILPQLDTAVKTDNGDNRKKVLIGDFVVNSRSDRKGSCGISEYDGSVSLINTVLKPLNILADYVHYMFRSNNYIEEYYRQGRGIVADLWTTRYSEMKNIQIPYPPITEQQAIVDYLKDKTLKIEQYVSERERERELLDSLKQSEIANVVTKGLNPNVRMKDSGIPWIGMIPEHWEIRKIKFLFKERSEKGFPNEPVLCATQKYGVIPQSMYENRVVVVNKGLDGLKLVKKGDFVISLRSFQGGIEYAHYQGIISAAYTVLMPSRDINPLYVKYLFKSHPFIGLLKTCVTGIREGQNINYDMLRNNSIMLPPASEQQAIVDYIEAKLSKIDSCMADLQAEIDYLKEFKQRLICDVVTGQICVAKPQRGEQK